jgi:hypothetical protein
MSKMNEFEALESDLEGKAKIKRVRANIWIHEELKETILEKYGEGQLGRVLEAGALMKLRRDGYIPEKPRGAEPAGMDNYAAAKKEKVALEEIKDRVEKSGAKKPA